MSIPDNRISVNGISVGHPSAYAAAGFEQKKKGWYVLFFQLEGIAEKAVMANDWALFRRTVNTPGTSGDTLHRRTGGAGGGAQRRDRQQAEVNRRPMMMIRSPNRASLAIVLMVLAFAWATSVHAQSASDCAARAERVARNTGGVIGGAAAGSAGGAAIGAIVSDNSRKGARKGARIGAAVGGTTGAVRRNNTYNRAYDDCMARRY